VGGVVGGALDAVVCRAVGRTAKELFKHPKLVSPARRKRVRE
jgi:hypothetical protein